MAKAHLLPALPSEHVLLERSLWTFGWSEGSQRQAMAGIEIRSPFQFSSLPNEKGVRLSLTCLVSAEEREHRQIELDSLWQKLIRAIPPEAIVDSAGADLIETVQKLLIAQQAQVSVAESCTGGGLGALLTELPGSSAIFQKGFLTYSNQAKYDMLGVALEIIQAHGAVSELCALAMAKGCLERSGAQYACAITGIAGPDGGTEEKPVGTVWIAVATPIVAVARRFQLRGDRREVRSRSCYSALNLLRLQLLLKQD
jgi:nicotinamide-nucleotide amidase